MGNIAYTSSINPNGKPTKKQRFKIGAKLLYLLSQFLEDPQIDPDETLEPEDYRGANAALGTQRGHQAPLGTFRGTNLWRQTNYLSNLTPQQGDLNGGVWKSLEQRVIGIVNQCNVAYVMTGTLYERDMPQLPEADEPHVIPSGYWKIVALNVESDPENLLVSAFIFDQNTPSGVSIESGQVTVDDVEERSGLDFFSKLPDDIEGRVESELNYVFDASLRSNNLCQISSGGGSGGSFVDSGVIKIVEMLPNPEGDENELESITIKNTSDETIDLSGWRFTDKANTSWELDGIGSIEPEEVVEILRSGGEMALNNGGDTVSLFDGNGKEIDRVSYSRTTEGTFLTF